MKAANVDSWKCDSMMLLIVINTEAMTKGLVHNSQFHFGTELWRVNCSWKASYSMMRNKGRSCSGLWPKRCYFRWGLIAFGRD